MTPSKNFDQNPAEIIIVDQTLKHERNTEKRLSQLNNSGSIRWIRFQKPSISHAMNVNLLHSNNEIVLFVDDDIIPYGNLIIAHFNAHKTKDTALIAGRVIQPWDIEPFHDNNEISQFLQINADGLISS